MADAQELERYKKLAETYKKNWEASQHELEEFQCSSRELEAELETQLDQQERKLTELTSLKGKLETEVENLREKYQKLQTESRDTTIRLEDELLETRIERDEAQRYIRELEQLNDDLERAKRALVCSLEDFEKRMNEAIERNAFLESELDEKETLMVSVQRLKEETRDLKQELCVRENKVRSHDSEVCLLTGSPTPPKMISQLPVPVGSRGSSPITNGAIPSHLPSSKPRSISSVTTTTPNAAAVNSDLPGEGHRVSRSHTVDGMPPNSPFTPSARISALNIVGDLLRKVGALESKLASCKKYSGENNRVDRSAIPAPKKSEFHCSESQPNLHSPVVITKILSE